MGARGLGQVAQAEDRSPVPWRGGTAVHPGASLKEPSTARAAGVGRGLGAPPGR